MRHCNCECDEATRNEHRLNDGYIAKMSAPFIGIIHEKDIARTDVIFELAQNCTDLSGERPSEYCDPVRLRDQLAGRVTDTAGKIKYLVNHRAHAATGEHEPHLISDG